MQNRAEAGPRPPAVVGRGGVLQRLLLVVALFFSLTLWRFAPCRVDFGPAAPLASASVREAAWQRRVRAAVTARVAVQLVATALRAACSRRVQPAPRVVAQPAQSLAQQGAVRPTEVSGVPAALPSPWAA